MDDTANSVITLSYWNVLILPTGEEIFVGMRQRPDLIAPDNATDTNDQLLPFALHNSNPIKTYDAKNGFGSTVSDESYVLIGEPSDPHGMIRFSVSQMMRAEEIHWKYDFAKRT